MNNPFLSDRNIFSKVVNPIRKKKQEEKKDEPQTKEPSFNPLEKNKDSIAATFKSSNNNLQPNIISSTKPIFPATTKITFGEPRPEQQRITFDRSLLNNPRDDMYENMEARKSQNREETQMGGRIQQYKANNESERYPRDTYKSIHNGQNSDGNSLNQQYKFEQFRKKNNLNDCSPINASADHINSSQFLNIDALGDDINKFLAQSRNQQQLCKLLGIQRTNKNINSLQRPQRIEQPIDRFSQPIDQFLQRPVARQTDNRARKQPIVTESMIQYVPSQPNAFTKKINNPPPEVLGIFTPDLKMQQSEKQIPTFNYKQIDAEDSQQLQQEYKMPSFAAIENKSKKGVVGMNPSQSLRRENMTAFNSAEDHKQQSSLERIIQKQMMELSMNGKYRTFLTASEKIVTVRYRLQPL